MPRSARKRLRGNLRTTARRLFLDKVSEPFGKCHWCGSAILWLQRVPAEWAVEPIGHDKLRVLRGTGELAEVYLLATVDHVEGLAEGGSNHPFNLVAACSPCNNKRGRAGC